MECTPTLGALLGVALSHCAALRRIYDLGGSMKVLWSSRMTNGRDRRRWKSSFLLVAAASILPIALGTAAGATVTSGGGSANPYYQLPTYLALGDSVAFGYAPSPPTPPANYLNAANFVGYPNYISEALHLPVHNVSCPGETTASFINSSAMNNGCTNSPAGPGGYRTVFPLHNSYVGSQLQHTIWFLKSHPNTKLITIDIGANDAFVCQETTADKCTSSTEFTGLLGQIGSNLSTIYAAIRHQADYEGPIVAVSYYSLNYADPVGTAEIVAINNTISTVTATYGGITADGFGAFQAASASSGGNACAAGLLIPLGGGVCNIHPTQYGHQLLAMAVVDALRAHGWDSEM